MDVLCLGDNVVDMYVDLGRMYPGGNAVNVSVHLSRRGISAGYAGTLADDYRGSLIRDALAAEYVDLSGLKILAGHTGYCRVNLVNGERIFETGNGEHSVSSYTVAAADFELAAAASVVHTGDNSFTEGIVSELGRRAKVSFDFGTRPRSYCEPLMADVWFGTFSVTGHNPDDAREVAEWAAGYGLTWVLVTEGAYGASLWHAGQLTHMNATGGVPVDTLGAGDATIAGVLTGVIRGNSPEEALDEGMSLAAATCREYGAFGHGVPISME